MEKTLLNCGNSRFELLCEGEEFLGIGKVWIADTLVRSGRLPWRVMTASCAGCELARLNLLAVENSAETVKIRLRACFRPQHTHIILDHSMDPIHDTSDWPGEDCGEGDLTLVLRSASDRFAESDFSGFDYHYEYRSATIPLFYLYDMSSWEIDGDINGATAISQSSCSAPVANFTTDSSWSTEGRIHWDESSAMANPVMTHNLPRWASHQAFDYQYKGEKTLLGVWERVDLIRSVLRREAGKPELKVFDKYLFDETLTHSTPAKAILLNCEARSAVGQQNLWTWTIQQIHDRARAEYGIREEPVWQRLYQNLWANFTIDSYYTDLLPAAIACGFDALFVDNLNKSDMTEIRDQQYTLGNMCCQHEFEPAPRLGGTAKLKRLVRDCASHNITVFSWTNPCQSAQSPLFTGKSELAEQLDSRNWYPRLPDTRNPYMGAYIPVGTCLDMSLEVPRRYFIDCLKKIHAESGHHAYLWDSFYNSAFMPVSYANAKPHTQWRGVLAALKELQDDGHHFFIESFGPWGDVMHGCPASYNVDNLFACYKIQLGSGYTTIPSGEEKAMSAPFPPPVYYRILAYMSKPDNQLFYGKQRIDELFGEVHRRMLREYNQQRAQMHRRYLQEDDQGVIWHNAAGTRATLWNFTTREVALPGTVYDLTSDQSLAKAESYHLEKYHTYAIEAEILPTSLAE